MRNLPNTRGLIAPGRVNLIGEHTDYNDGFVLPAAIARYTQVTVAPRVDRKLRGVALMLERAGYRLSGAHLSISSAVPIGAGLSSSAALEVAVGYALLDNSGHDVDRLELAKLCRQAENEFVGMRCGIMDQFIACLGRGSRLDARLPLARVSIIAAPGGHSIGSLQYYDQARAGDGRIQQSSD